MCSHLHRHVSSRHALRSFPVHSYRMLQDATVLTMAKGSWLYHMGFQCVQPTVQLILMVAAFFVTG